MVLTETYYEWAMKKTMNLDKKMCAYLLNHLSKYGNTLTTDDPSEYLDWLDKIGLDCYVMKNRDHYILEVKNGYGC